MNTGRHVYVGNATANPTPCTVSSYFAPEDCADFFSLYTLKENQFVSVQQGWEGREGVATQQRWSAALWVSDIPDAFEREMAMTACGTCVQIKWTNRKKNALLIGLMPKCLAHSAGSGEATASLIDTPESKQWNTTEVLHYCLHTFFLV